MPVIDLAVEYKRPARYDDLLEITACFDETPRVRVRLDLQRSGAPTTRRSWWQDTPRSASSTGCAIGPSPRRPRCGPSSNVRSTVKRWLNKFEILISKSETMIKI